MAERMLMKMKHKEYIQTVYFHFSNMILDFVRHCDIFDLIRTLLK